MKLVAVASPNYNLRPKGVSVDCIVLHADASPDAQRSINWIKKRESGVSYHVLVDRDGTAYRFVESGHRAWHAGVSSFRGRKDVNDFAIGLAFANRNDDLEEYTEAQYQVGASIAAGWMRVYPLITLDRITTHAEISPGRKTDPGPRFDMEMFKRYVGQVLAGGKAGQ